MTKYSNQAFLLSILASRARKCYFPSASLAIITQWLIGTPKAPHSC